MKEVELSAGTIRYREIGQGPTVVFVHGVMVSGELWDGVVERLAQSFRCIVPEWPHGSHSVPLNPDADLSPTGIANLIAELLTALDLNDVTLVGNDSGGAFCQILVTRHPERVGRLVLTTCDAFEVFPPSLFGYLSLIARVPPLVWLLVKLMVRVHALRRLPIAYGSLTARPIDDALIGRWLEPMRQDARIRRDARKVMSQLSPHHTLAAAQAFAGFARPVLVVWSPEDRWFPVSLGERLRAAFPDARLELVPHARVFIALDQPAILADKIARFTSATVGIDVSETVRRSNRR